MLTIITTATPEIPSSDRTLLSCGCRRIVVVQLPGPFHKSRWLNHGLRMVPIGAFVGTADIDLACNWNRIVQLPPGKYWLPRTCTLTGRVHERSKSFLLWPYHGEAYDESRIQYGDEEDLEFYNRYGPWTRIDGLVFHTPHKRRGGWCASPFPRTPS